jgi:Flp pilus assembly pilin Flp
MRSARAGQSVVEYFVLVTMLVIAAIAGVGLMNAPVNATYTNAAAKANDAAAALGALAIP